jgi:hypothetical protein
MYPTTGNWPTPTRKCPRCGNFHKNALYCLCDECRDDDLIMRSAQTFAERRAELLRPLDPMKAEGYESPFEIRASLGL